MNEYSNTLCLFEYLANNPFPTPNLGKRLKDTQVFKLGQSFFIMTSSYRGIVFEKCQIPAGSLTKKKIWKHSCLECVFFKTSELPDGLTGIIKLF